MTTPYVHDTLRLEQVVAIRTRFTKSNTSYEVRAPLPETIPFSTGNEIDESFEFLKLANRLAQSVGGAKGISIDRGLSEEQHWKGITNQEFTMELQFQAFKSGKDDVVVPIKTLLLMATPEPSAILKNTKKIWQGPPTVSIRFGNIITLNKVWIKTVNVQFSNKLDDQFDPIFATASVTFIPSDPIGRYALKDEKGQQGINDVVKYSFDNSKLDHK